MQAEEGDRLDRQQSSSVFSSVRRLLAKRPGHLYRAGRGYLLFHWARFARRISPLKGIELGANVRLQRNGSLVAELPGASISIGADGVIYEDAVIEAYGSGRMAIGPGALIGGVKIYCRHGVRIGERFLCSWNVFIQDYDSHPSRREARRHQVESMIAAFQPRFDRAPALPAPGESWNFPGEEILIGDDVWIGTGAVILKGARIGSGSVVSANTVVVKGEYPEDSLIAGNPGQVVKQLSPRAPREIQIMPDDNYHVKNEPHSPTIAPAFLRSRESI